MSSWDGDITPAVLLEHIQAMRVDLSARIDRVESRLASLDARENRHYHLLSAQIDVIGKRFDVVEVALIERR